MDPRSTAGIERFVNLDPNDSQRQSVIKVEVQVHWVISYVLVIS